jgi:MFS family permease
VAQSGAEEHAFTLGEAMHGRNFWLLMIGTALGTLPMTSITVTIVPMFLDRGITPELAAVGLSGFGITSVSSRFFWGPLADRFHVRQVLVAITIVSAAATVSIFGAPGLWALSYGMLTGFGIGGYVGLYQAVWGAYYGRRHLGSIAGVTQPLVTFVNAAGSFVLAFIHDSTGSYDLGIWLFAADWLACGLLLYLAKPEPRRVPAATPN